MNADHNISSVLKPFIGHRLGDLAISLSGTVRVSGLRLERVNEHCSTLFVPIIGLLSVIMASQTQGAEAVPPGAAALGYTTNVINEHPTAADIAPGNANNGNFKWFNGPMWDGDRPDLNLYSTVSGDLAIRYDPISDKGGTLIGTPRNLSKGYFPILDGSKGFYIEFDTRLSDNDPNHWPAVWVMPVEHSGGPVNPINDIYPGDVAGYERWMEIDVDEGSLSKSGGAMCSAISWTGSFGQKGYKSDISNNWATGEAIDRTKVHTFGASYDPIKRQVSSWVDGVQKWQTAVNSSSVPMIAAQQHFYAILSLWRTDGISHKAYTMYVSGVRAYIPAGSQPLVTAAPTKPTQ